VTPTLNQAQYLEATIRSVRRQSHRQIEHIVVDGGSTDGTHDLLRRLADGGSMRWMSEPDEGMYDAINKGLALTTGDVLAYLNSDDAWLPWAVETVLRVFDERPEVEVVFGDGIKIDEPSGVQRLRLFPPFDRVRLANHESIMQPAVFWRRSLFERIGGFDSGMRYVADLDYWLRAAAAGARIEHVNEVIAIERIHEARLSSAQKDRMAAEDRAMRAKHAGDRGGPAGRTLAMRRTSGWKAALYRRFLLAWCVRGARLRRPWPAFLRHGRVKVRWTRALPGMLPRQGRRLRDAFESQLAAEILRGGEG
jgi:GT2 family glycosyltransferase